MTRDLSRRDALGIGLGSLAGITLSGSSLASGLAQQAGAPATTPPATPPGTPSAAPAPQPALIKPRKRTLRLAHITDTHIEPELRAPEGVAACFAHIRDRKFGTKFGGTLSDDPVELVLHGGDMIFDSGDVGEARTKEQWDLFTKVIKDNWTGPINYAIGNHDIFGLNKAKSGTTGNEPNWGKRWAMELLGIRGAANTDPKTHGAYYSFDRNGWHIVVLDSVQVEPNGYFGGLDDKQFDWLKGDLLLNKMHPTLIMSHIPIMTCTVLDRPLNEKRERVVPAALMCIDFDRIKKLFLENPQVKACLSGHMHLIDHVDYNGVSYCCNGAVSANWWKGPHRECKEGYGIVDLYDDGSFENKYIEYGWKADKA